MTAPDAGAAFDPDLFDDLPSAPGGDVDSGPYVFDLGGDVLPSAPGPAARPALTPADLEAIEAHNENLIYVVAQAGADTLPVELRARYIETFTHTHMIRAGVNATGVGAALHELLPASGEPGGPVKQLHPVIRVVLGLGVLALATVLQRRAALATYSGTEHNPSGAAGAAGGSFNVQNGARPFGGRVSD